MTDDELAIRDVIAQWLRASEENDTATVMGLMTDDVLFCVPGQPPFGKETFAAAQDGLARFTMQATSHVREVTVAGDWGYAITDLKVEMTPVTGGPTVRRSGNTLSIFRRASDGRWQLARDANLLTIDRS